MKNERRVLKTKIKVSFTERFCHILKKALNFKLSVEN